MEWVAEGLTLAFIGLLGLFQTCAVSGVVLGAPSARLREPLERAGVRIFSPYQSL